MRLGASLLVFSMVVGGTLCAAALGNGQPARGWHNDYAKAETEAKQLGVPLVVHFYADWCGPCRQMEADVLHKPELLAELGVRAVGVKVNSDHRADLVTRYGITALPSDVIVAPDGKVLVRTTGAQDRTGYIARIAAHGNRYVKARAAAVAAAAKKSQAIVASAEIPHSGPDPVGLSGYSPVALTSAKKWVAGLPEYTWTHEGILYRMTTAEELQQFKENPARYAPQFLGCDPMILSTTERAVSGNIKYGAFWRGGLYLFYSEDNRGHFLKEPTRYTQVAPVIQLADIELLTAH